MLYMLTKHDKNNDSRVKLAQSLFKCKFESSVLQEFTV